MLGETTLAPDPVPSGLSNLSTIRQTGSCFYLVFLALWRRLFYCASSIFDCCVVKPAHDNPLQGSHLYFLCLFVGYPFKWDMIVLFLPHSETEAQLI